MHILTIGLGKLYRLRVSGALALLMSLNLSCSTPGVGSHKAPYGFKKIKHTKQEALRLKALPGQEDTTDYYSVTHSKESEGPKVSSKKEEVDFAVLSTVIQLAPRGDIFYITSETTFKDGNIDLRDYGFPELKEVLDIAITKRAKILLAGDYPQDSVFFVPPLPLPDDRVAPGETWQATYMWKTRNSGVPLKLNVVAILKGYFEHKKFGKTANIEVSGDVEIIGAPKHLEFSGYLNGHILFSLDQGKILWSKILNKERVRSNDKMSEAKSCMISKLRGVVSTRGLECNPEASKVQLNL